MKSRVVVVGSLRMDFVFRAPRLPAPGETVPGESFHFLPGGKGAAQACAAARTAAPGVEVKLIGRVGYDLFADQLRASLAALGVDVTCVHATQAAPTGTAVICAGSTGEVQSIVAAGANLHLKATEVEAIRPAMRDASAALFQLETPLPTVEAALRLARCEGALTILDPAPPQPLPDSLLTEVSLLTSDETQARLLLGLPPDRVAPADAPALARRLLELGPGAVALRLGNGGVHYSDGKLEFHHPTFSDAIGDTSAAADAFNGALAAALAEGLELPLALRFASAAAALAANDPGAPQSLPTRSDVLRLLTGA